MAFCGPTCEDLLNKLRKKAAMLTAGLSSDRLCNSSRHSAHGWPRQLPSVFSRLTTPLVGDESEIVLFLMAVARCSSSEAFHRCTLR